MIARRATAMTYGTATMVSLLGAVALLLAAVGIYGVLAHSISLRFRELGVRSALGAGRGEVLSLVLGYGLRLSAVGLLVGLAASVALARTLSRFVVDVRTHDPLTVGSVAAVLISVGLAASLFPALRATRIDPVRALRSE